MYTLITRSHRWFTIGTKFIRTCSDYDTLVYLKVFKNNVFSFSGNVNRRDVNEDIANTLKSTIGTVHGSNCIMDSDCSAISYCKRESSEFKDFCCLVSRCSAQNSMVGLGCFIRRTCKASLLAIRQKLHTDNEWFLGSIPYPSHTIVG